MDNMDWYDKLVKPMGTPPSEIFGVIWPILYLMMAVSLFLFWRNSSGKDRVAGIVVFVLQLILNFAWSPVFFGMMNPTLALVVVVLLWLVLVVNIWYFARYSQVAAWLLVPYLIWVTYATYLNAGIVVLN